MQEVESNLAPVYGPRNEFAAGMSRQTLAEAKDLYQQLHELFGAKPIMWPSYPIVIERDRLPWQPYQPTWVSAPSTADPVPQWPVVTCRAGGSGLTAHYTGPEQG